jgi:hypothetical protein
MMSAFADIAWAEKNGYGTAADYGGFDALFAAFGAVTAFIDGLTVNRLTLLGTLNGIAPDQIVPNFTHRMKYEGAGTFYWTVPENVKFVRVTVRGAGGGGGGGDGYGGSTTHGTNGSNGTSSSFGGYLEVAGGNGGTHDGTGGSGGTYGTQDATYNLTGGRNGQSGGNQTVEVTPGDGIAYGGTGGIPDSIIGIYNDSVESTNIANNLYNIWPGTAAICPGSGAAGYNGYPGNGGAGGGGYFFYTSEDSDSGGGGGAGAIRQQIFKLNESAGSVITIVCGTGGAGGAGGTGNSNGGAGGRGGDGQVMIEW